MNELPGSVVGIIGASAIGRQGDAAPAAVARSTSWYMTRTPVMNGRNHSRLNRQGLGRSIPAQRHHLTACPDHAGNDRHAARRTFPAMKDGHYSSIPPAGGWSTMMPSWQSSTGAHWALLDVTDPTEPLPTHSPFFALENCVLIPHQAGNSVQAGCARGAYTAEDMLNFLDGRPLKWQVRVEQMATMA